MAHKFCLTYPTALACYFTLEILFLIRVPKVFNNGVNMRYSLFEAQFLKNLSYLARFSRFIVVHCPFLMSE